MELLSEVRKWNLKFGILDGKWEHCIRLGGVPYAFAGRVSDYLHSIDDKKTANHVKATIIKLMADNSPWENVAQNTQTAV